MGYSPQQIEEATENCIPLRSRGGAVINAKEIEENPNCSNVLKQNEEKDITTNGLFKPNKENYSYEGRMIGASAGILIAVGYAFKTKSGFAKGLGYWLLGSIVLGGLGYGVGSVIKKK